MMQVTRKTTCVSRLRFKLFKVERRNHAVYFNILDIPDFEIVKIDTEIKRVLCYTQ